MKAVGARMLDLLKVNTRFEVPIYQRSYTWNTEQCERLWDDILHAGDTDALGSHFTGSIVYVEREEGARTSPGGDMIIDGQQRVATIMLLLAALANTLDALPIDQQEPVEGFSPKQIRNQYLTNSDVEGERRYKLILSVSDRDFLKSILDGTPAPHGQPSKVLKNYQWFISKLANTELDLTQVCLGLKKLVIVDVSLNRGTDDPQLVFETMNSLGMDLTQTDLIRNFVLMNLPPTPQKNVYENYWLPMEKIFDRPNEERFDEFVRHYVILKTGDIPKHDRTYDEFKIFTRDEEKIGTNRPQIATDMYQHAVRFSAMALGTETNPSLSLAFQDLERLQITVVYPFLLRVYSDYDAGLITSDDVGRIVALVTSYVFRRGVCEVPPNTHRKTFANLGAAIDPDNYVTSIEARLLSLRTRARFPSDDDFREALTTSDLAHFQRLHYLFRKLENVGRKEEVSTGDYSIEHIMPQNPQLSPEWRNALGENWEDIQKNYLHTLGNLTLTGYNSEYSDKPFSKKRDMEGGFKQSPLHLNAGLGQLDRWTETEIRARAARLAGQALSIWTLPSVTPESLEFYKEKFASRSGFDWSVLHEILDAIPEGKWTSYSLLGEAVETHAQPLASHLSKCTECTYAYRVLTWDGRIAQGFQWSDATDQRDPQAMLEAEGITFTDGKADHECRFVTEDLLALIED